MTAADQLLTLALEMRQDGHSLIPVQQNKRPYIKWEKYQTDRAGAARLRQWAADPKTAGFAVVCGPVSGGLEILDFDDPVFYAAFMAAAPDWAATLPVQKTGGGGFQMAYRRETPGGNVKLAWAAREADADGVVIEGGREIAIETRGAGGYAVIPHSLHPSGNRYAPLIGTFGDVPTIEDAQAEELLALARGMDQTPKQQPQAPVQRTAAPRVASDAGGRRGYALGGIHKELDKVVAARPGERNEVLNNAACALGNYVEAFYTTESGGRELVDAITESEARQMLTEAAAQQGGDDPDSPKQVQDTISSGLERGKQTPRDLTDKGEKAPPSKVSKGMKVARQKIQKAPAEVGAARYTMPRFPKGVEDGTDAANALILAGNHLGERLRYTFGVGWYVYDQRRGIWREDDGSLTLSSQVAGEVLRAVVADHLAALVKASAKDEELEPAMKWAYGVGSNKVVSNALRAAAGRPEFLTDVADWDSRPDLLNCRNGVLELTSGTLRPHAPSDLLTWQAGALFDPAARHAYVDQLTELLKRDGRHDFLQRLVGSALYGEAPNEVAILLEGEGMTGKGTLVSAVAAMLGDYATTVNVELLLSNSHGESSTGPKPELLNLRGKRLAVAGEPPKGARFNSGRVKGMTGNDPITARAMRSNILVEFKPVFKLWIHTNYPINTAHDDTGMQRRLRVVPFKAKPERPYAAFKSTLENDPAARAALLNWAYEGFRLWHSSGFDLGMSAEIEAATGSYWKDQNPYEKFAAACLIFSENAEIQSGRLKTLFEEWAEENGAKMGRSVKMADLYAYLQTFGCEARRTKSGRFWDGVTEVTEVTPQPQLSSNTRTLEGLNRGQAVIGVIGVTRDDVATGEPVAVGWEGEAIDPN